MINEQKLRKTMDNLGFAERHAGTAAIRAAVTMCDAQRDIAMTKELYPALAKATGAETAGRIERNMRHAIASARSSCEDRWLDWMGFAAPTNCEVIRRLADGAKE